MDYQEVQLFRSQLWVCIVILAIAGLQWYIAYQQLILGRPVGTNPASNVVVIFFWIIFGIVIPFFFWFGGVRTEVRTNGLHLQIIPIPICAKHFDYAGIETYEACQYRPLRDFGGWGIRFGPKGKAYTVSGNKGLQLTFKSGKNLLIGSQYPDRLVEAIDRNISSSDSDPAV